MLLDFDSKNKKILFIIFAAFLAVGIFYLIWLSSTNKEPEQIFCTMEAKLCPDGSYVGRTGPKCEFAACPEIKVEPGWKIFDDSERGVSFQYPEKLSTKYISAFDWPPQIRIINGPFCCLEAGSEIAPAGKTEKRMVDNREYCVTKESEGAAGSIYTLYAYAFPRGDKVAILSFSIRAAQCGNYDEPSKSECEAERLAFDIDGVIDRIAKTFKF